LWDAVRHVALRLADAAVPRDVIEKFKVVNVHAIDSGNTAALLSITTPDASRVKHPGV
jgi:hypothetical protein